MFHCSAQNENCSARWLNPARNSTFHAAILGAVANANIDELIDLGVNAAQGASQPLRAAGRTVSLTRKIDKVWQRQVLSILAINGVTVTAREPFDAFDPLLTFALHGASAELMKSDDAYIQELACLHGPYPRRHEKMMETAFDPVQDITLDAIEQARQSMSI